MTFVAVVRVQKAGPAPRKKPVCCIIRRDAPRRDWWTVRVCESEQDCRVRNIQSTATTLACFLGVRSGNAQSILVEIARTRSEKSIPDVPSCCRLLRPVICAELTQMPAWRRLRHSCRRRQLSAAATAAVYITFKKSGDSCSLLQ